MDKYEALKAHIAELYESNADISTEINEIACEKCHREDCDVDGIIRCLQPVKEAIDLWSEEVITPKVYIAGKITGCDDFVEKFTAAESKLRGEGYKVENPIKNKANSYKKYIDLGLKQLSDCDYIYLLSNYKESRGAKLELQYAETVGIRVLKEE